LFKRARKKKVWFELDVAAASVALKAPRERIVAALNYLDEQGDLTLKVGGVRVGYRRLTRPVRDHLLQTMTRRFVEREQRDLERLKQVLEFASHRGCRTRYLAAYFGEDIGSDCGHCGWCSGEWHGDIPGIAERTLGESETRLMQGLRARRLAPLSTPRQLTRFLCGLSSPATSRAKLTGEPAFGAFSEVPFKQVLQWVEVTG
jgi:ATP-dependent DNA helicase RecQ